MNEKDVAFFGTLLGETEDNVKQLAEDGLLGDKISALGLMNKDQVETLKANYAKEVRDQHLSELTEAAKKGELPQDLYKPVHGAVLEKTEKALSKKYEVVDFNGFDDLVEKAIAKNKGQSDDTRLSELESLNADLKEVNKRLVKEKEEAVTDAEAKLTRQLMTRDMNDQIMNVPFDFSDVDADKMDEAKKSRKEILNSVFAARYDTEYLDGRIVVKDKEGNVIKNTATLEPVPVADVLMTVSKDVGLRLLSPEAGGQGGSSSGKNGSRFKSEADFRAYCADKGIVPTSAEGIALLRDSGLKLI